MQVDRVRVRAVPVLALALAILAQPAAAELFRWVDPVSGSVKFSSYPPPWFGDPPRERGARTVERLTAPAANTRATMATPAPSAPPAQAGPPPSAAVAVPGSTGGRGPEGVERLRARLRGLLQALQRTPVSLDSPRASAGIQQQLNAYNAVAAELDRIDPAGARRRRAEAQPLLERLVSGLRTQPGR